MASTSVAHGLDEFAVQYPSGHTPETLKVQNKTQVLNNSI